MIWAFEWNQGNLIPIIYVPSFTWCSVLSVFMPCSCNSDYLVRLVGLMGWCKILTVLLCPDFSQANEFSNRIQRLPNNSTAAERDSGIPRFWLSWFNPRWTFAWWSAQGCENMLYMLVVLMFQIEGFTIFSLIKFLMWHVALTWCTVLVLFFGIQTAC